MAAVRAVTIATAPSATTQRERLVPGGLATGATGVNGAPVVSTTGVVSWMVGSWSVMVGGSPSLSTAGQRA